VKDSGVREEFSTGAVRDTDEGKGRPELISPIFLKRLALLMEKGAKKYSSRNWEQGMPVMRYISSALRHINCWVEGYRDEDHLIAAAFNLMAAVHVIEMIERGRLPVELLNDEKYGSPPDYRPVLDTIDTAQMTFNWEGGKQ
jgi:hypothetical protein